MSILNFLKQVVFFKSDAVCKKWGMTNVITCHICRQNPAAAVLGMSNRPTLNNFAALADYCTRRPDPPFLVAITLLVPGYVDQKEVAAIAAFIAGLNPDIPYSLLAFYPHHLMSDLPLTSRKKAESCREAALAAGLKRVRLGNVHLLR